MKVTYDNETDSLTVILNEQVAIAESDEDKPGIILDYDKDGNLVSIEVLDASQRITEAKKIEFQTTG
jgi:YD repeat-containing protein